MNSQQSIVMSTVELKQRRVRHLKSLMVKNLQVVEPHRRFGVWFTMHALTRTSSSVSPPTISNAFYISERKENERNPKWNLSSNLPKLAAREFLIRVWIKDSKLRLLIEMEVLIETTF